MHHHRPLGAAAGAAAATALARPGRRARRDGADLKLAAEDLELAHLVKPVRIDVFLALLG